MNFLVTIKFVLIAHSGGIPDAVRIPGRPLARERHPGKYKNAKNHEPFHLLLQNAGRMPRPYKTDESRPSGYVQLSKEVTALE